jgi:phosphate transport system protein
MEPEIGLHHHKLDQDLIAIRDNVLRLSHMTDHAIEQAFEALNNLDITLANAIVGRDNEINRFRNMTEQDCYRILSLQQPTARDLRSIITAIHIVVELERIADYAAGIAKLTLALEKIPTIAPQREIKAMQQITREMLTSSLDAYLHWDIELARQTFQRDDEVDTLDHKVTQEIIGVMIDHPIYIHSGTYLLWITHSIERMADRITNICERVIFMVTGQVPEDLED